jgi:hypothetical protein
MSKATFSTPVTICSNQMLPFGSVAPNQLPNVLDDKTVNVACKELTVRDLKPLHEAAGKHDHEHHHTKTRNPLSRQTRRLKPVNRPSLLQFLL